MKKEGDVAHYFRLTRNENVLISREGTKDESMAKNKQDFDCEKVAKLAFNSAVSHKLKQGYQEVGRTTRVLDPTALKVGGSGSGSDDESTSESKKVHPAKKSDVPISKVAGHIFKFDSDDDKDKGTASSDEEDKTACKYGSDCIRKNPEHFKQFSHPKGFKIPDAKHVKQKSSEEDGSPKKKPKPDPKKAKAKGGQVFAGMSICLTGGLPGLVRKEAQALIVKYGGKACNGISKNVTHVVASDPSAGSSKLQKAEDLGIEVMDDAWFMDLLGEAGYGKD
jgi:NAD-dependent DNA ligase